MKRYNSTHDTPPEDMVEDKNGQWVDAEIAQRLYDELSNLVAVFEGKGGTKPNVLKSAKQALKSAKQALKSADENQ
jgi:hypothetical protein